MTTLVKTHKSAQSGFTMIEVILTFAILAIATTALGLVELGNSQRQQHLKARDIAFARGQAFMERILRMPFGTPNATGLTNQEYDTLFGTDDPVTTMSLTQIQQKDMDGDGDVDETPIRFMLKGVEDEGIWEVFVDSDLDGNGLIEPLIDGVDTREGRSDLLRIEIRRNQKIVLRTIRARTPQEQDASGAVLE